MMEFSRPSVADPPENKHPVLPRYLDLIHACRDMVVSRFTELFRDMFEQMDDFMLNLAENAETNQIRSHYFEVMHELLLRQGGMQQVFCGELNKGFDNFESGINEPLRQPGSQRPDKLSLVEKDVYEISLAYSEVMRKANDGCAEQLFALNHRLAVLNGGRKPGEFNPALPGSPAQLCDALQIALEGLEIPIDPRIHAALADEFERRVLLPAPKIYQGFNEHLIQAGILPNLSLEAIGYKPPAASSPASASSSAPVSAAPAVAPPVPQASPAPLRHVPAEQAPATDFEQSVADAALENELFRGIQQMLAGRHEGTGSYGIGATGMSAPVSTNFSGLMTSLNSLQMSMPPIREMQFGQVSLETLKETFSDHVSKLSDMVRQQQVSAPDADIIDLVGMLFEFILNDSNLPDSVKALLSHLHTPILKVALLDRKFFFRSKHPARRLLNALTQAGSLCGGDEGDGQGVFAKVREVVERIVQEFDNDTKLFDLVLEDFLAFQENFGRRSRTTEKRSVETAKGRERLREARQTVSQEIIDRTWDKTLPKAAENLLMGAWANLLVLTYLRNGKDSEQWQDNLKVVDDLIWCVQPKSTRSERRALAEKLPELDRAIRNGLAMIGDPEVNTATLLAELNGLLQKELEADADFDEPAADIAPVEIKLEIRQAPPEVLNDKAIWDDIQLPDVTEALPIAEESDVRMAKVFSDLKSVKLGTWFEFEQPDGKPKLRAKLSWYSPKTSYYIFVDQAGIQVAVKPLKVLAKEILKQEVRIVPLAKKPFMDRAMEAVHTLLKQPSEDTA